VQIACVRPAASAVSAVSAFKPRRDVSSDRPSTSQPGRAAAAGIAGRRTDLPQHGPGRLRCKRWRKYIKAGKEAPRSRTMEDMMFYIQNHQQIIDFNTIFSL